MQISHSIFLPPNTSFRLIFNTHFYTIQNAALLNAPQKYPFFYSASIISHNPLAIHHTVCGVSEHAFICRFIIFMNCAQYVQPPPQYTLYTHTQCIFAILLQHINIKSDSLPLNMALHRISWFVFCGIVVQGDSHVAS